MRAETLAVGTELLLGDIVNGNAAEIGAALATAGIDCYMHTVVGDNEERIAAAMAAALGRSDAVIVTGGLGPTQDDVTREAIAALTGRPLIQDGSIVEALHERFRSFGREMPERNLRQADVPEGATVIRQTFGTAPGLIVEHAGGVIYAVPGVPAEMREMLARAVLPDLASRGGATATIASRVVRVAGMTESGVAEAVAGLWDRLGEKVTMAFLAGGGEVRVRLTTKAPDPREAARALDEAEAAVREVLGSAVFGADDQTLEAVCGELLRARGLTMACAESLTGGGIGARITSVPGSSDYFRGSIVAYATAIKRELLGVPDAVLSEGPVSGAVARAMASGVRTRLGVDVGLAVTGVAGPAEQGAPVGTVCVAVEGPGGADARQVLLPGDRGTIRRLAGGVALNLLRLHLLGEA